MRKLFQSHVFQWTIIFLAIAWLSLWLSSYISEDTIAVWMENNAWAPWIYIWLKSFTIIFAPLSGTALYAIGSVLWPFQKMLIYAMIGNILWFSIVYWLGYCYADRVVQWMFGSKGLKQAHSIVDKISGYWSFLIVRIVFFPLEDLVNYTAGMAKVPFWWFLIVNIVIGTVLVAMFVLGFDRIQNIL